MTPHILNINKTVFRQMRRIISIVILIAFISTSVKSPAYAQSSQVGVMPHLPLPGIMVHLSPEFTPAHLQGITIHPNNALQFDFLIHEGDDVLSIGQKEEEYTKLIRYFLASLTIPDDDQWVNLSPYEKDRIIKDDFGKTEMGRDLLAQDYLLKQITSSLIYPENGLGKKFWDKVYERAWREYHTTDIPVNTFNKVWIVPDQAYVYESGNTAYILKSHLKVMLEEDYMSLQKHTAIASVVPMASNDTHAIGSQVIREIILPELEKEVNEGKNFANLRQMFSGMILATWYKKALKESLLGKVYADRAKVKGIDQDPKNNEAIYHQYLKAFKKGVFNYIKEDVDKYTNETIPRKYFSGGFTEFDKAVIVKTTADLTAIGQEDIFTGATIGLLPAGDLQEVGSGAVTKIVIARANFKQSSFVVPVIVNKLKNKLMINDWNNLLNQALGLEGAARIESLDSFIGRARAEIRKLRKQKFADKSEISFLEDIIVSAEDAAMNSKSPVYDRFHREFAARAVGQEFKAVLTADDKLQIEAWGPSLKEGTKLRSLVNGAEYKVKGDFLERLEDNGDELGEHLGIYNYEGIDRKRIWAPTEAALELLAYSRIISTDDPKVLDRANKIDSLYFDDFDYRETLVPDRQIKGDNLRILIDSIHNPTHPNKSDVIQISSDQFTGSPKKVNLRQVKIALNFIHSSLDGDLSRRPKVEVFTAAGSTEDKWLIRIIVTDNAMEGKNVLDDNFIEYTKIKNIEQFEEFLKAHNNGIPLEPGSSLTIYAKVDADLTAVYIGNLKHLLRGSGYSFNFVPEFRGITFTRFSAITAKNTYDEQFEDALGRLLNLPQFIELAAKDANLKGDVEKIAKDQNLTIFTKYGDIKSRINRGFDEYFNKGVTERHLKVYLNDPNESYFNDLVDQSTNIYFANLKTKPRFLYIEDEKDKRDLFQMLAEAYGFHVTVAEDGESALDILAKNDFDMVLTDGNLRPKGLTGAEVLKKITDPSNGVFAVDFQRQH